MSRREAQRTYVEVAKTVPYFGMSFFDLREDAALEVLAGVAEDGLFLFRASNLRLEYLLTYDVLVSWRDSDQGIEISFQKDNQMESLLLELSSVKREQMLMLLDGYYALLPKDRKREDHIPNDPNPNILPVSGLFKPPEKRGFFGRFRSRLEYLKGYYMESCMISKLLPVREFCQQIDQAIDNDRPLTSIVRIILCLRNHCSHDSMF